MKYEYIGDQWKQQKLPEAFHVMETWNVGQSSDATLFLSQTHRGSDIHVGRLSSLSS